MKRGIVPALALLAALTLAGCEGHSVLPYAREMDDMALLRTMGLDLGGEGSQLELTVSTGSRASGFDGERQAALVLSAGGSSIGAASLAVQGLGDSYVFYGYVDQVLLGEELAQQDVTGVLGYLAQSVELDLGVQLWVVRNGTAQEAIESAGAEGAAQRLSQMQTNGELGAAGISRTAGELIAALADGGSAWLPALSLVPAEEGDGGEEAEQVLHFDGYAVFKQGRLVSFLDGDAARGLELMEGQAFGRVTDLSLADGTPVTVRLEEAKTRCVPRSEMGELTGLEVCCELTAQVIQAARTLEREDLELLRRQLERLEGERLVHVLGWAQYWDTDFLGLARRAGIAAPQEWGRILTQWQDVFRDLDIQVAVTAEVRRVGGLAG